MADDDDDDDDDDNDDVVVRIDDDDGDDSESNRSAIASRKRVLDAKFPMRRRSDASSGFVRSGVAEHRTVCYFRNIPGWGEEAGGGGGRKKNTGDICRPHR
jgi:hypothetical protein